MQEAGTRLIASIIDDAGGKVVGSTRLHEIAYLLEVAGYNNGFKFDFRNSSPYSDEVAEAATTAVLFDQLSEDKRTADWGGRYSVYSTKEQNCSAKMQSCSNAPAGRQELTKTAAQASAIALDLVATAIYLSRKNCPDPWAEAKRRKPDLAKQQWLRKAKKLLKDLSAIDVPEPLPAIR